MTEEEVKLNFITPAIQKAGWLDIRMEKSVSFTDGPVQVFENGEMVRGSKKRADYLLNHLNGSKLAIVEAKSDNCTVGLGLAQAVLYAKLLNVPFAYSSNGKGFIERDMITGEERELTLAEFPSPDALRQRYIEEKELSPEQLEMIEYPDYYDETFKPRYYQKASVDKTMEAIAKGKKRALIVLATGTGKTYTAFQLVWKLKKMRKIKKVLYLADRNILIQKPHNEEFAPFGDARCIIKHGKIQTSRDIFFGLYQQLDNNKSSSNLEAFKEVSPDFFDLIIVDECHRGSAREDSHWREILQYFNSAIQIGMTATPKVYMNKKIDVNESIENADDIARSWFGEPVYIYSLKQGIEDGYLAPYKVITKHLNIDVNGYRPKPNEVDINGNLLEDRIYTTNEFDRKLIIESRIKAVAKEITDYLKKTDRFQKTIVFCCNIKHAENLRRELWKLNLDICQKNPKYVVQITGDQPTASADLENFTKVEFNKDLDPCIVTTSDLMTTGVDCKTAKVIILDKVINSMTLFKQIIGRGTRLRVADKKYEFYIMDFRNVTRLFADKNWDGDIQYVDEKELTKRVKNIEPIEPNIIYHIDGDKVTLMGEEVKILDQNGNLVVKSLIAFVQGKIQNKWSSLNDFLQNWSNSERHSAIVKELKTHGVLLEEIREQFDISNEIDDFDLICHVGFGRKPLTRSERIKSVKKSMMFDELSYLAKNVVYTLLDKYSDQEIEDIDNINNFNLDEFKQYGSPRKIINDIFGGPQKYFDLMTNIKNNLYGVNL